MQSVRSPHEAYRKVDFDARVAGADPRQLVLLCYEQLGTALGGSIHAAAAGDNIRKSASLTRALSAITALQMGLDHNQAVASALGSFLNAARRTVLDCVIEFDAGTLEKLRADIADLSVAFRQAR